MVRYFVVFFSTSQNSFQELVENPSSLGCGMLWFRPKLVAMPLDAFPPSNSHEWDSSEMVKWTMTVIVDPDDLKILPGHFSTHGAASFEFACHPVLL